MRIIVMIIISAIITSLGLLTACINNSINTAPSDNRMLSTPTATVDIESTNGGVLSPYAEPNLITIPEPANDNIYETTDEEATDSPESSSELGYDLLPSPSPLPSPDPLPSPSPLPTPTPLPLPSPLPTPALLPSPSPLPSPAPLPSPSPSPIPAPSPELISTIDLEQAFFEATNAVRKTYGLPILAWHDTLASVARLHSRDMADHNRMVLVDDNGNINPYAHTALDSDGIPFDNAHIGTDGSTLLERVEAAGMRPFYDFTAVAENLGVSTHLSADVVNFIMQGWMDSPGHRENILHESLTHIALGVVRNDGDSAFIYYITQKFIRYP